MSQPPQVEHQPITDGVHDVPKAGLLYKFWETAIKVKASDLHVKPNRPIKLRVKGQLRSVDAAPFDEHQLMREVEAILTPQQLEHFHRHGSIDIGYDFNEDNRFRVNIFRARGHVALAARRVSSEILGYDALRLPASLGKIADLHQGLVLLAGITGSGKSTTIAAMLQQINEKRACHIVTLEDPIEYMFKDAKATVNQREIGMDVPDFTEGLRALVREDPDVVLIGELRDAETFAAAMRAAETGHLVFGTVHASSCAGAFGRIYNLFAPEERDLVRDMLSQTLQAIIYQRLVESIHPDVPRVPAVEVLLNSPVTRKYIEEGREPELVDVIRNSQEQGMIDYSTALVQLVEKQYIHPRTALEVARNPDEVKMRLKGIKTGTTH